MEVKIFWGGKKQKINPTDKKRIKIIWFEIQNNFLFIQKLTPDTKKIKPKNIKLYVFSLYVKKVTFSPNILSTSW